MISCCYLLAFTGPARKLFGLGAGPWPWLPGVSPTGHHSLDTEPRAGFRIVPGWVRGRDATRRGSEAWRNLEEDILGRVTVSPPAPPHPPAAESVGQPEEVSPEGQQEEAGAEEASAGEERPEEEEEEEEAAYLDGLPEPLLLRVLAELPAAELVQACRLVCLRWKELVDGAPLWLLKCQQEGLVPEGGAEDERDHWQQFYFLSKRRRNLLRNPCGEEDLEGWCDVEHGGDGWRVEDLPGDCGAEFIHDESVKKYFASSFEWCRKAQVIDLQAEGYWEELLDTTQPAIAVKDWYSGRRDAGCLYELTVKLLSEHEDVLAEFSSGQVAVPPDSDDAGWIQISHTFTDYGPGVRFVRFEHGGQDSVYWKGWFGARVTNSSVWVEP